VKNQKTWVAVILLGTVAVNAGAYLVVRARKAERAEAVPAVPNKPPAPVAAVTPPPEKPAEDANSGLARALRASGLAALEDRDYDRAVADFSEALRLNPDDPKSDLPRLLGIATGLRSRGQTKTAAVEPPPPETPPSSRGARTRAARLAAARAAREEQQATAQQKEESARPGLLLVTSTPPGLVVKVDGKTLDLTPARLTVSAGTHRVVLAQGDRQLLEETVEVESDGVRSLNRDLTAELAPAAPKAPAVVPVATSAPVSTPAPSVGATPASPAPDPKPPAPSVATAAVALGALEVTSPGLYGEVWINSRPYGFPPVSAQSLPAGPARVEVRVNGEVKRRMTVAVEAGRSTRVRVK
jgi:hypothetical protein